MLASSSVGMPAVVNGTLYGEEVTETGHLEVRIVSLA
jgi:hypothetical protein